MARSTGYVTYRAGEVDDRDYGHEENHEAVGSQSLGDQQRQESARIWLTVSGLLGAGRMGDLLVTVSALS